ncbi:hypothetical protein HUT16_28650 [Kitasatospora sp. NA04385]|uniref:hypothetical protein n=1 Tax=Kitasatospora sp. NA04385 TaxID=2742135 RepID=UPI00159126C8|nr:hypothetical protein [Kitasatospora sp. NA04385]QKW17655.1 hypothetical protein HUT16_28650 [Kitasatospora sp. NA04385]
MTTPAPTQRPPGDTGPGTTVAVTEPMMPTMAGKRGDGKGGVDGDKKQSPRESDGQWSKPIKK